MPSRPTVLIHCGPITRLGEALATRSTEHVTYTVGAMGGWMVAMDDAHTGAPHPPALGHTELMLPPPPTTKRFADRPPAFGAALDAIREQHMPPPPARNPGYFSQGSGDRLMPARPTKRARQLDEEEGRSGSRHTSDWTFQSTVHSRERAIERELTRLELQADTHTGSGWVGGLRCTHRVGGGIGLGRMGMGGFAGRPSHHCGRKECQPFTGMLKARQAHG